MNLPITPNINGVSLITKNDYHEPNLALVIKDDWEEVSIHSQLDNFGESLPILATANDLREFVKFLKRKPFGISIVEAMSAEPRRIFDARKIAAYEFWGVIERDNKKLILTDLGNEFAQKIDPEVLIYRQIISRTDAYFSFVKWIYEQDLSFVTHFDAMNFWQKYQPEFKKSEAKDKDMEAMAVTFFSLCHAAELGTATVGKRGQPARLRVELEEIQSLMNTPDSTNFQARPNFPKFLNENTHHSKTENLKISISTGKQNESLDNFFSLLSLIGIEYRVKEIPDLTEGFLHTNYLTELHQFQASLFLLNAKDCETNQEGDLVLCIERVTEINVALALFGERVIVAWLDSTPAPKGLLESCQNPFIKEIFDCQAMLELAQLLKDL